MKTKKKFGMRRHIGITAAATLIALGTTACEEAYWGGKDNRDTYKGLINNFNTENGHFDSTLNCKGSDNCFWNELHDGCSANAEDNIQNLKILLAPNIKSDASERLVVICSRWKDDQYKYDIAMGESGLLKIGDQGIPDKDDKTKQVKDINYYNGWLCKSDSERKLGRLICDEIAYYLYDGNTYSKCDKGKCGDLDKEMPEAFKNAFNYRVCPEGYDYRAKYIGDLTNVCVKSVCNGVSINLYTDNDNCGTCGEKCKNTTCVNGKCDKVEGTENSILCGNEFINPENDNKYCGAKDDCKGENIGTKCAKGEVCSAGSCGVTCVSGQIICNGQCIDPKSDNRYCGANGKCIVQSTEKLDNSKDPNFAGSKCKDGEVCSAGSCGVTCVSGQVLCNGQCIDPLTDNRYCGATGDCKDLNAGEKCASGKVCSGGTCDASCLSGQVLCNGQCIDPDTDNRYCGATGDCLGTNVGEKCASGKVCSGGTCGASCLSGQILCIGQCIDPDTDNRYCGATGDCQGTNDGEKCASGKVCSGGTCDASCLSGQVLCNGQCIDPQRDNRYCGASKDCSGANAGKQCGSGQVCSGGSCGVTCVSDQILCNGQCIDPKSDNRYCGAQDGCTGSTKCKDGEVCSAGKCGTSCLSSQVLCGGNCIVPETDNAYCGAKKGCTGATKCKDGEVCSDSKCGVKCVSGQILCNGQCIDPNSDNRYCGANGKCSVQSTEKLDNSKDPNFAGSKCKDGEVCSGGKCGTSCLSSQVLCGGKCIVPETDNAYCGAKGKCNSDSVSDANYKGQNCADGTKCTDRVCKISCVSGQIACDGECINLVATNVESCTSDKIQCKVGYENCDKEVANGCEVDTSNDNAHCGGCGNACTTAIVQNSASVQCSNGGCKATSCARGYVLKNGECKVSNTLNCCGTLCTNCYEKYPNMKEGSCNITDSTCTLQRCNVGYVVSSDGKKCDVAKCLDNGACGDSGKCINGECKCGTNLACSGDTPICNNSQCVACTSETHCPSVANATATCKSNKCEYQCVNDFNNTGNGETTQTIKCENCEKIYSVYVENSGGEGPRGKCVQCSNTNLNFCHVHAYHKNASTYGCDAINECIIVECDPGYHFSSDRKSCEPDTIQACGAHDKDCTGEQGLASSDGDSVECVAGECKAKACIQHQFYLDEDAGKCVASDDQNCGGKGLSCEAHNETGTSGSVFHNAYICNVNNGKCELKCQDGKVLINDSCVNCSNNGECGDSKKCPGSGFGFGGSKKCHCSDDKDGGICSPGGECESNNCTYPSKEPTKEPMANS